jgi:hypothetical protein
MRLSIDLPDDLAAEAERRSPDLDSSAGSPMPSAIAFINYQTSSHVGRSLNTIGATR